MAEKKKILFLSSWMPYPANNGSKLRIYNLLKGLSLKFEVVFISLEADQPLGKVPDELAALCREVHLLPTKPYNPGSASSRSAFLSPKPRLIVDTYSPAISQKIHEIAERINPDLVIASQLGAAMYRESFQAFPALFEEAEVGLYYERFHRAETVKGKIRHGLTWWKHSRFLRNLLKTYQACTVVSSEEKKLLQAIGCDSTRISVVSNGIDLAQYTRVNESPQPDTLIFTGSFKYYPNHEAMVWFLKEVYPRIKKEIPTLRLTITGDSAGLPLPEARDVIQTGFVSDIRPLIARSWASIVPLQSGGGTRLKIIEAMGLCTPVITTSKGAEGIEVENGSNILVADTPEEFSASVIRLMRDPNLRQELASQALQLVRAKYDWQVILPQFCELLGGIAQGTGHGA